MISKNILYGVALLLSILLSFIVVNRLAKYVRKINKYKYTAYVTAFVILFIGSIKVLSIFNPALIENYQDLLEHISIPKKFKNKPTTSIDTSIFEQKQITPSVTTVISAPVDKAAEVPVAYVDPTPPPPPPVAYSPETGFTGFTITSEEIGGYSGYTSDYTGYTETTSDVILVESEYTATDVSTGYTSSDMSTSGYTGYTSTDMSTIEYTGYTSENVSGSTGYSGMGMGLGELSSLLPLLLTQMNKQPEINVNIFNENDGKSRANGYPNADKYNMDNCLKRPNQNNSMDNREKYNYPAGNVRTYDEWKKSMDKDNDYVLMDQNKVNRMHQNARSSSCPVCPLDINYPFSNYRSGR